MRCLTALVFLIASPLQAQEGNKIVEFVREQEGKKVGNGQCAELVVKAFRHAKMRRLPPYGPEADYCWGTLIATYTSTETPTGKVQPGDILQFKDAKFSDGIFNHHTVVVNGVKDKIIDILHQNVGDGEKQYLVQPGKLDMADLQSGVIKAYRSTPLAKPEFTSVKYNDSVAIDFHRGLNVERMKRGLSQLTLNTTTGAAAYKIAKMYDKKEQINNDDTSMALQEVGYLEKSASVVAISGSPNGLGLLQFCIKTKELQETIFAPDHVDLGLYVIRRKGDCVLSIILSTKE